MNASDAWYCVYVMTNLNRTLYIGATDDLRKRVAQHKEGLVPGSTARYKLDQLIYVEEFASIKEAIAREKQLKGWSRAKKLALIRKVKPEPEELVL